MFGINKTTIIVIGVFLTLVFVFSFGYYKGHQAVQVKFDEYKAQISAAGIAQENHVKDVVKTQEQITKGSLNVYKANAAAVSNYYRGMRGNSGSCNLPQIPNAPTRTDGATDYTIFVGQCAQTTNQLNSIQNWILDQQQVDK